MKRLLASIGLAALALSSSPIASAQGPAAPAADNLKTEMGEIDGASFRIDVPANWNHGLVIMNHGYSMDPRKPQPGAASARIKVFTDRGYAVAQSSYSKGGWAAEQAIADNEKLRQYFVKRYGKTTSLWATGGAMGASITMIEVEMHPELYSGGLATCCGTMVQSEGLNANFRMLALFDYYFPGVQPPLIGPLNGYTYGGASDAKIKAALEADPQKAEMFRRTTGRRLADLPNHVSFQTYIIHEAQERSGGNPFDNSTFLYVTDDEQAKVNDGVKRYEADPKAEGYLKKWYTPTGKPQKPLFIMEPVYDPVVSVQFVTGYVDIARKNGGLGNVAFQFFDHEGHGALTNEEVAAAFDQLVAWSKGGPKPRDGHGQTQGSLARRAPAAQ